jgi:hypothetical protein
MSMAICPRLMKALLRPIAEPLRQLFAATGMTAINAAMGRTMQEVLRHGSFPA